MVRRHSRRSRQFAPSRAGCRSCPRSTESKAAKILPISPRINDPETVGVSLKDNAPRHWPEWFTTPGLVGDDLRKT